MTRTHTQTLVNHCGITYIMYSPDILLSVLHFVSKYMICMSIWSPGVCITLGNAYSCENKMCKIRNSCAIVQAAPQTFAQE